MRKNHQTYHIETYGCQMNVYDSELISGLLENSGYFPADNYENADLILLNTCSIRNNAEETVHRKLENIVHLKQQDPKKIIGVVGCMAQNLKNDLLETKPYVDIILGPDSYRNIPDLLKARQDTNGHIVDTKLSKFEVYDNLFPNRKAGVNAWVSIMRGCDKFCTFCIVPFTRGRERSRSNKSIVREVKNCVSQGFVEITLLGQNVNSYCTADGAFPELMESVAMVDGVKRLRYTSPHPSDIDTQLLEVMAEYPNICNHIHLPLQAGSNRILSRMNRTYTQEEYLNLCKQIKKILPNCSITTDIIVGFPGETDKEFEETIKVAKLVEFDMAFMFKYSSRPGTKAAEYTDQVLEDIKQERLEEYIALQKTLTLKKNKEKIGQKLHVLIEKESKKSKDQWAGRTEGNSWVIFDKSNDNIKDIVPVSIIDAQGVSLFGKKVYSGGKN